jgi:hypothetical protein
VPRACADLFWKIAEAEALQSFALFSQKFPLRIIHKISISSFLSKFIVVHIIVKLLPNK